MPIATASAAMAVPRLGRLHLFVWAGLAALAMGVAVRGCLVYNSMPGTDKTPGHIALIALASNLGPFVGPVANPADTRFAHRIGWPALALLVASVLPFLLLRRPVGKPARLLLNAVYVGGCLVWFVAGFVSLGFSLS